MKLDNNSIGGVMVKHLARVGKVDTETLAKKAGVSVKEAYDRLYWLAKREGFLVKTGKGKSAEWRLSATAKREIEAA